jgi:hypothetical protein
MRACTPSEATSAALVREERRDLRLVGLELLVRAPHRRVLVGRVLELDHGQRQAVDEEHHVRAARVLSLGHGELVDGQPVVVVGLVEVDHPRLRPADGAVLAAVLDRDAIDQHPVHGAVALDAATAPRCASASGRRRRARRVGAWVEAGERGAGARRA